MSKVLLATTALLLTLAPAVHAADLTAPTAPISPALPTWTGFYVGAFAGGRVGDVDATACGGGGIIGQNCATDISLSGPAGGVTAGYDHQFANGIVLGAFVSVPVVRPTATATTPLFEPFGISWKIEPQYALFVGARLGYAMGDVMPYVLAGASWARVKVTLQPAPGPSSTADHAGVILGGGAEIRLSPNFSLDGRYVLGLMGDAEYSFCDLPDCRSSYDEVSHNLTLGLNYRF